MNNLFKYNISTNKDIETINIDKYVNDAVNKSNVEEGICLVYTPHTTAGITINENGDYDVRLDLEYAFDLLSPKRIEYRHFEGNTNAHLLSSIIGCSESLIIQKGKILLGTWQSIYFCEFDGPRNRDIFIKIL